MSSQYDQTELLQFVSFDDATSQGTGISQDVHDDLTIDLNTTTQTTQHYDEQRFDGARTPVDYKYGILLQ
jgi:hypothetical protein